MIRTTIFAAAAALTMVAATSAMAQDYRGLGYSRGYDANASYGYGDNWDDNDGPAYRGGDARYGSNYNGGYYGGSVRVPTRSDRSASNGYVGGNAGPMSGYAHRNGFVCEPGTVFINSNGIRTLCQ